jgi:tetratricopeptide (TPR) repeat protein
MEVFRLPDAAALMAMARDAAEALDLTRAERLWREAVASDRRVVAAHQALVQLLIGQDRLDAAQAAVIAGLSASPHAHELWAEQVRLAQAMADPDAAMALWRMLQQRFPQSPAPWIQAVHVAFAAERTDAAREAVAAGLAALPGEFSLLLLDARLKVIAGQLEPALAIVCELISRSPEDLDLKVMRHDIEGRISHRALDGESVAPVAADHDAERDFFLGFESLGANCEFGFVQRRFGAEPISLLRWSAIDPDELVRSLDAGFVGLGDEAYFSVFPGWNHQWDARDSRYFTYHTYIGVEEAGAEQVARTARRRMAFMRDKLLADLAAGEKIFVYKEWKFRMTEAQILAISQSLRRHNPANRLLAVRLFDAAQPAGVVRLLTPQTAVGAIEVDARQAVLEEVPVESWRAICREAAALLR